MKYWDGRYPASVFYGAFALKEARKEYDKMRATAHERESIKIVCSDCGYSRNIETLDKSTETITTKDVKPV